MEKSIENIWNEGFLKSEDLIIPKVNDLYNRKSTMLIEKMKRTMAIDHWAIIPVTMASCAYLLYLGSWVVSAYNLAAMCALFYHNRMLYQKIFKIDQTSDTYDYLQNLRAYIHDAIKTYTRMCTFIYPFFILPIYWVMFRDKDWYNALLTESIGLLMLYLALSLFALSLFGAIGYRLSVKLVYGRMLRKLSEIITDMEELKAEKL